MNGENERPAPPSAPVVLDAASLETQIEDVEKILASHRKLMVDAKKKHEQNLERVKQLRKSLGDLEKATAYSDYERLSGEEGTIMGRLQNLTAKLSSIQSKGRPIGKA